MMGQTTADKLNAAIASKERIRQAIEAKGINCGNDIPLSQYPEKILSIQAGGSGGVKFGAVGAGGRIFGFRINITGVGQYAEQDIE